MKVWVLCLYDGRNIEIKADTKDEAKKIAYDLHNITWLDIKSYEIYYK